MIRVRMKISYTAWKKDKTVKRLILEQIIQSYIKLNAKSQILPFNVNSYASMPSVKIMLTTIAKGKLKEEASVVQKRKGFTRRSTEGNPTIINQLMSQRDIDNSKGNNPNTIKKSVPTSILLKINKAKLARVQIVLLFSQVLRLPQTHPLQNITLILEKELLQQEIFFHTLLSENRKYFRIPQQLTQEVMPVDYLFYNCVIPALEKANLKVLN